MFLGRCVGKRQRQQDPGQRGVWRQRRDGVWLFEKSQSNRSRQCKARAGAVFWICAGGLGGSVAKSLPLDACCRLPMAKRIGRAARKDFPRGVGAGDGVEDGAREKEIGCGRW